MFVLCVIIQGDIVEGEYRGEGVYQWPDGSKYTGTFTNNRSVDPPCSVSEKFVCITLIISESSYTDSLECMIVCSVV